MNDEKAKEIVDNYKKGKAALLEAREKAKKEGYISLADDDSMMARIEYDDTFEGRHLLIVHHYAPGYDDMRLLTSWYCGYLKIRPSDPAECLDFNKADDIFQSAPGGITLVGELPEFLHRNGNWVGFDTAHYGMEGYTKQMCIAALQQMVSEVPSK